MASDVDIANLAIARLGSAATVSSVDPADGSAIGARVHTFYPMVRDSLLELKDWPFAMKRSALSEYASSVVTPPIPYEYAYAVPSDMVVPVDLRNVEASDDTPPGRLYMELLNDGRRVIYSDTENAVLRYKIRANDPTKYTPLFVDAFAWMLAGHLTGPVVGGDVKLAQYCIQMASNMLGVAVTSVFSGMNVPVDHNPVWLAKR